MDAASLCKRAALVTGAALVLGSTFHPAVSRGAGTHADPGAYARCIGCHSLDRDRTGPRHCGLLGRVAGTVPGFAYSRAMSELGMVWDRDTLDAFLADPTGFVPGTSMGYAGIADSNLRQEIIEYIEDANNDPDRCPDPAD